MWTRSTRKWSVSHETGLMFVLENAEEFLKELYKPLTKDAI